MTTPTRPDLGRTIYETLSVLLNRLHAPARQTPLADLLDSKARTDTSVLALQELTGLNLDKPPSVPVIAPQRQVANLYVLIKEIKTFLAPHMKGKDYEIRIPSKPLKMRNQVNYKHYDVLAYIDSEGKTFIFTVNEQGQYILSEKAYWVAI